MSANSPKLQALTGLHGNGYSFQQSEADGRDVEQANGRLGQQDQPWHSLMT